MKQFEIIADKIEESVGSMFSAVQTASTELFSYTILFNPNKHYTWLVALFAATNDKLKSAIRDGSCYLMYKYLQDDFQINDALKSIDIFTSFEVGSRPTNTEEYNRLHETLTAKLQRMRNSSQQPDQADCTNCGHDFNEHQLKTFLNGESKPTDAGWMLCPEDDCTCFSTWSSNYKAPSQ